MFCGKCGKEMQDDAVLYPSCGWSLSCISDKIRTIRNAGGGGGGGNFNAQIADRVIFKQLLKSMEKTRDLDVAAVPWDRLFLVQSDGYADYVEWEKEKPTRIYYGCVITVAGNSNKQLNIWVKLMKIGAATGCHQMHRRSFFICGYQFPVCARCTGLFVGQISGIILSVFLMKYSLISLFIPAMFFLVLLGIDGLGQLKQKWTSTNTRRIISGLLCSFFVIIFLIKVIIIGAKIIVQYHNTYLYSTIRSIIKCLHAVGMA
jgi:uncharacterized membrane protein